MHLSTRGRRFSEAAARFFFSLVIFLRCFESWWACGHGTAGGYSDFDFAFTSWRRPPAELGGRGGICETSSRPGCSPWGERGGSLGIPWIPAAAAPYPTRHPGGDEPPASAGANRATRARDVQARDTLRGSPHDGALTTWRSREATSAHLPPRDAPRLVDARHSHHLAPEEVPLECALRAITFPIFRR